MPEFSDYIEGLTSASVLDGTEIIGFSQAGNARKSTSGVLGLITSLSVLTTGGTITFDFASMNQRIFVGSASFGSAKGIALDNDTNAKRLEFTFNITNVAAVITFPSSFIMNDIRWNSGTKEWTPDSTGVFKGSAIYNGTNWILDISSSPYS